MAMMKLVSNDYMHSKIIMLRYTSPGSPSPCVRGDFCES